tara:strand:+ start:5665 stop:6477 length:813 start_codon:yes stop_codon:yes gene_type:complete
MIDDNKINYAIVFDLDETLGHFSQLYIYWNLLKAYLNTENLDDKYFFKILDAFPEFLRPNIIKLLTNIKKKKQKKICNFVMIYTNNNGPTYWAQLIKSYLHYKLKYNLFDKIIGAFKVNGKIIEVCRTTHGKSFTDFISCTKLPENTQICFLDDQYHKDMEHENVLYINVKPYTCNIKFEVLADKTYNILKKLFIKNNKNSTKENFIKHINQYTTNYKLANLNKSRVQKNIEIILTNHLIKEIDKFFKTKPKNTTLKKRKKKKRNQTKKN